MLSSPTHGDPVPDVVVIGESLIDIINSGPATSECPGGSAMNVAFGLGRLGVSTALLTALGQDKYADHIETHLRSAGVRLMDGARHLKRTATATATLDAEGSAEYSFDIEWDLPQSIPGFTTRALHAGSIAIFLEPGASKVRELMGSLAGTCLITYDPNIRAGVIGDHSSAVAQFEKTGVLANVIKLSSEDAAWLYPGIASDEIARKLLTLGANLVVVTDGSKGAHLFSRHAAVNIPVMQVHVVDTVGAGDSFMASLIANLLDAGDMVLDHDRLHHLGTMAATAAAITVTRQGAVPPTASEIASARAKFQEAAAR